MSSIKGNVKDDLINGVSKGTTRTDNFSNSVNKTKPGLKKNNQTN